MVVIDYQIGQHSRRRNAMRGLGHWLGFLGALASVCGCSGNTAPVVAPVHGQVLYNGRPIPNAQVTFHPVGETGRAAVRPVGKVDEQGRFSLTSFHEGDGAPPGEYRVTVVWYLARPVQAGSDETVSANYLPAKYAIADTSQLTATVTSGANELKPFDLK
jgi:hypothetical protein